MGKKQSPFIGRRVPLVDNGVPILYARYSSVEDILLDGDGKKRAAPEAEPAAAGVNGTAEQHTASKKQKTNDQQQDPAAAATAAGGEQQLSKKERKRLKQQQEQQEQAAAAAAAAAAGAAEPAAADASEKQLSKKEQKRLKRQQQQEAGGADPAQLQQQQQQQAAPVVSKGNADEAARIRQVLGFTAANGSTAQPPTPQPAAAAAAAAAAASAAAPAAAAPKVSAGGGFTFNFNNLSTEEAVAADMEAKLAAITAVDTADKEGYVPRRVFVGGMPYSYSQEQIEEYWGWCGQIEELDLMTFPDTGRFRGIAFITFTTQEGADAALACNGEQLDGQTLKVERCKAAAVAKSIRAPLASARSQQHQQQQQQQRGRHHSHNQQQQGEEGGFGGGGSTGAGPARTPGYNVAYVGNIAFEARPEDISALFEACNVTKVRLHTDKDTRKSKGYAHVHFADEAGLEQAISMSGTQLMGRGIKVSYGQPKKS